MSEINLKLLLIKIIIKIMPFQTNQLKNKSRLKFRKVKKLSIMFMKI